MSKVLSYEEVDKEQLVNWIELCHDLLDEKKVKDSEHGALYSVFGRLGIYVKENEAQIAALEVRLKEAEEVITFLSIYKNYATDGEVKTDNGAVHVSDYCAAFLKGGTQTEI